MCSSDRGNEEKKKRGREKKYVRRICVAVFHELMRERKRASESA